MDDVYKMGKLYEDYWPERDGLKVRQHFTCGLGNYYGEVLLDDLGDGVYMLNLADHSSTCGIRVSQEFADAFIKEFSIEDQKDDTT